MAQKAYSAPQANVIPQQPEQPVNPITVQQPLVTQPVNPVVTHTPNPSPTPRSHTHVVERGETAMAICRKFSVRLADLENANPTMNPSRIWVGEVLTIP